MENIFEGAQFGDRYQMRNGWIAIYLSHYNVNDNSIMHRLCTELDGIFVVDDNGSVCQSDISSEWDIVSRYQEPIDENELNELATKYGQEFVDKGYKPKRGFFMEDFMAEGFEAGYCKAMEG